VAVTYTAATAANIFTATYRAAGPTGGIFTYNQRRIFMSFDLPGAGVAAGSVVAAQLILNCTVTVGGGCPCQLRSDKVSGWGTTLDSTHADWASTQTSVEDTVFVAGAGTYTWNVNPANLSFVGRTWFSIWDTDEGLPAPYQTSATFNSEDAGTPTNRPILRLTLASGQVIFVQCVRN
jgi:hypothetical protein